MMKRIAYIPLTPLGDSILLMAELIELHRLYDPCEITVFAIPLIAELYSNFSFCDHVVMLKGGVHGKVTLDRPPPETFDILFNHGYEPWYDEIIRMIPHRCAYGMEERFRHADVCRELFDKWVSLADWENVTMQRYPLVPQQMAELIRLVSSDYRGGPVRLTTANFRAMRPNNAPVGKYILFLPGTSAAFKHYPTKKFLALAELCRRGGYEPVFAIGPQDQEENTALQQTDNRVFVSLPLGQLAGLIVGAELVIGNDSGPMHLAASFDVPTIHLFSFSGAQTWFCYEERRHRILMPNCGIREGVNCKNCARTCIGSIRIRDVVAEMEDLLGCHFDPLWRIAYFAQDRIGDTLVWANQIEALFEFYAPCEIVVFTSGRLARECLSGFAFCDWVVGYDSSAPWTEGQIEGYGHFDAVFNARYDADSLNRVVSLRHQKAYGFESAAIPKMICRAHYDAYLPLTTWDDFHLRRETSVTSQGAMLVKLVWPEYECDHVELSETTYVHDFTNLNIPSVRRIVFVLGASDKTKNWGIENYLELARDAQVMALEPLFILGPEDEDTVRQIRGAGYRVVPGATFDRIAALLSKHQQVACVVGNDTGVMHLASMLGAPTVTIITHGANFTWFPYEVDKRARHVCCKPPCASPICISRCRETSSCISKISIDVVECAIREVIKKQ